MLVLTRREGQKILINNGSIELKVLRVVKGHIRLGFLAPKGVDIDREEVYLKKLAQKE